jgi:hypothetical protein
MKAVTFIPAASASSRSWKVNVNCETGVEVGHFGLHTMRERATAVRGHFDITTAGPRHHDQAHGARNRDTARTVAGGGGSRGAIGLAGQAPVLEEHP